jgi:trimeric autotransporter adhesin
MQTAQATFNNAMQALIAALNEAGALDAAGYATKYATYMAKVNASAASILSLEGQLANKNLLLAAGGLVTWDFYLTQLTSDLAALNAGVAANTALIAGYTTAMNNPTAVETQKDGLLAQIAALTAANAVLDVEIAEALNVSNAAITEYNDATAWVAASYTPANNLLIAQKALKQTLVAANTGLTAANVVSQTAITDYPAALAALQLIETTADALVVTTTAAKVTSAALVVTTATADTAAAAAALAAATALSAHNTALAALNATYQTAIANYATEQGLYDAGIAGANAALTAANTAVTAGLATVAVDQADYDAKKAIFEAAPGGVTWSPGPDGLTGNHADGALTSKIYVVTANSPAANSTNISTIAVGSAPLTGAAIALADVSDVADNSVGVAGDYYDFEFDDIPTANSVLLDAALLALTASNAAMTGLDTTAAAAQVTVNTYGNALAAAIVIYNDQKALYDNGLATQATLVAADNAATTAATAATAAATAAGIADTAAALDLANAITAAATAAGNVTTFSATTIASHQASIDANLLTIAANLIVIAEHDILIAKYQADVDAIQAEYDALISTPLYAALEVAKIDALQAWQALVDAQAANGAMNSALNLIVTAINGAYTFTNYSALISAAQVLLDAAPLNIENKEVEIAKGIVDLQDVMDAIANLEAQIAVLEAQMALDQALADQYKALFDAAIAG